MLESLISSKTRIKLLLKFFLNPQQRSYLRGLATEFEESTNAVRLELNRMEEAGLIKSNVEGNKKIFMANPQHPLFNEIRSLVLKHLGIDQIINQVIEKLGALKKVYLSGEIARGMNTEIIDVVLLGQIDEVYLFSVIKKIEKLLRRKIRFLHYDTEENLPSGIDEKAFLLIWQNK